MPDREDDIDRRLEAEKHARRGELEAKDEAHARALLDHVQRPRTAAEPPLAGAEATPRPRVALYRWLVWDGVVGEWRRTMHHMTAEEAQRRFAGAVADRSTVLWLDPDDAD